MMKAKAPPHQPRWHRRYERLIAALPAILSESRDAIFSLDVNDVLEASTC